MTIDIDDVNKLAHQLRTQDPQAEVTRHHMNRLHGVQTVNTQLERNHERFEREQQRVTTPWGSLGTHCIGIPVGQLNIISGRPGKRRTIYAR